MLPIVDLPNATQVSRCKTIEFGSNLSRYAASMAAPYLLGFIHLDLDG